MLPRTTKAVRLHAFGGPDVLRYEDAPVPEPRPGEARVRVLAAGVAYGDVLLRRGLAGARLPATPGYDLVGVVEALGPGVTRVGLGDRVAALPGAGSQQGVVCLGQDELVAVPAGVTAEKAVAVVLNYMTALHLLTRAAGLTRGQSAFVYGLSGGLGSAMQQVAAPLGVRLFGTVSGAARLEGLPDGVTGFDRCDAGWVEQARAAEPGGFDAVFDPVGGDSLTRSFGLVARRGRLVMLGAASATQGTDSPRLALAGTLLRFLWLKARSGRRRVSVFLIARSKKDMPRFRADLAGLFEWLRDGTIDPVVHAVFRLRDVREAHRILESGAAQGKVVLVPDAHGGA